LCALAYALMIWSAMAGVKGPAASRGIPGLTVGVVEDRMVT
jgi:hypothetical protein